MASLLLRKGEKIGKSTDSESSQGYIKCYAAWYEYKEYSEKMLVKSLKISKRLYIGKDKDICITVLESDSKGVKLAIDAPREIPIHCEDNHRRGNGTNIGDLEDPCGNIAA